MAASVTGHSRELFALLRPLRVHAQAALVAHERESTGARRIGRIVVARGPLHSCRGGNQHERSEKRTRHGTTNMMSRHAGEYRMQTRT